MRELFWAVLCLPCACLTIADVFWLRVLKYEGCSLECHVKLASSCVVASVMLDLSSGHCQDWKATLRKSILVSD